MSGLHKRSRIRVISKDIQVRSRHRYTGEKARRLIKMEFEMHWRVLSSYAEYMNEDAALFRYFMLIFHYLTILRSCSPILHGRYESKPLS